jgi:hypothetical protein
MLLDFLATKALNDAAISYKDVEQVVCGYVYGINIYLFIIHFFPILGN